MLFYQFTALDMGRRGRPRGARDRTKRSRSTKHQMEQREIAAAERSRSEKDEQQREVELRRATEAREQAERAVQRDERRRQMNALFRNNRNIRSNSLPPSSSGEPIENPAAGGLVECTDEVDIDEAESGDERADEDKDPPLVHSSAVAQYLRVVTSEVARNGSHLRERLKQGYLWVEKPDPSIALVKKLSSGMHAVTPVDFYRPDVFLYFPQLVFPSVEMRCPVSSCMSTEQIRHGLSKPRRVICIDRCFFVITQRMKCKTCSKTYMATHPNVIASLPVECRTADLVPFVLTRKSGLSKRLLAEMETQIGTGVGGGFESFRKSLVERHNSRIDELHLAYCSAVDTWKSKLKSKLNHAPWNGAEAESFVGTGRYLTRVFIDFLSANKHHMLLEMMQRGADRLCLDHSHKFLKMLKRDGGLKLFDSALQGTNEYDEIVFMSLSLGTAHEGTAEVLRRFVQLRRGLNQPLPTVVTTDNCCHDRPMLESAFPHLASQSAADARGMAALSELELPDHVEVVFDAVKMQSILEYLVMLSQRSKNERVDMVIGLDTEWALGGKVCTLQLSSRSFDRPGGFVYLFQLSKLSGWNNGTLPRFLVTFLLGCDIKFVGSRVTGDQRKLAQDFGIAPLEGRRLNWINLGPLASKVAGGSGADGLAKLVSTFLHRWLPKDDSVRMSLWSNATLNERQIKYACLDAWASFLVYEECMRRHDRSIRLTDKTSVAVGLQVYLMPSGQGPSSYQPIARCIVAEPPKEDAIHGVKHCHHLRIVVEIVDVPNAASSVALLPLRRKRKNETTVPLLRDLWLTRDASGQLLERRPEAAGKLFIVAPLDRLCPAVQGDRIEVEEQSLSTPVASPREDIGSPVSRQPTQWIMGDIFHAMERIPVNTHHPMMSSFLYMFKMAFFIEDACASARVADVLEKNGIGIAGYRRSNPEYFRRRIPRFVPRPEILEARLIELFKSFAPFSECEDASKKLFRSNFESERDKLLEHVRKGCYSDPENVSMYHQVGTDNDGLPLYRCHRGTNGAESNHLLLWRSFNSVNIGIETMETLLLAFITRHNITRSAANRTGYYFRGHYHPWILDAINEKSRRIWGTVPFPSVISSSDWDWSSLKVFTRNWLVHQPPDERIPDGGKGRPHEKLSSNGKFLALAAGTILPFRPVSGKDEEDLYVTLKGRGHRCDRDGVRAMAHEWNRIAVERLAANERPQITFKVPLHLEQYTKVIAERLERDKLVSECGFDFDNAMSNFQTIALAPRVPQAGSLHAPPAIASHEPIPPAILNNGPIVNVESDDTMSEPSSRRHSSGDVTAAVLATVVESTANSHVAGQRRLREDPSTPTSSGDKVKLCWAIKQLCPRLYCGKDGCPGNRSHAKCTNDDATSWKTDEAKKAIIKAIKAKSRKKIRA